MAKKDERYGSPVARMKSDYAFRTFVTAGLSFAATPVFACYNTFLGIFYGAAWNFGSATYYVLLTALRAFVIGAERKVSRSAWGDERKAVVRSKLFLMQSLLLFVIDCALIGPIVLMAQRRRPVGYTTVPAIATAAYTVCRLSFAAVNFKKTRKMDHLSVIMLRNASFIDALVSVLSLQYVLIMTFGKDGGSDMVRMVAMTSFAIWSAIVLVSALAVVRAVKLIKRK